MTDNTNNLAKDATQTSCVQITSHHDILGYMLLYCIFELQEMVCWNRWVQIVECSVIVTSIKISFVDNKQCDEINILIVVSI